MKQLVVVSLGTAGPREQRLLDLASWMGVPTRSVAISDTSDAMDHLVRCLGDRVSLALRARALAAIRRSVSIDRFRNFVDAVCQEILVFGVADPDFDNEVLRWLLAGRVTVRRSLSHDAEFSFPRTARALSRQLAGVTFEAAANACLPTLALSADDRAAAIMLHAGAPMFAQFRTGACDVFVLVDILTPDVAEPLSSEHGLESVYERLTPFLIFFRSSFGNSVWHGVKRTARVIIDDPLLRRRYGHLDFERLTRSMDTAGYGTTLAFIPWNYRRTSQLMAPLFSGRRSNISVCIHGCDHTQNEFGVADERVLSQRAQLAVQRMTAHERRTGIPFEEIMVFPQGRFSRPAAAALRANAYLAAVNSTCFPSDSDQLPITVGDFLRPAIQFHGLPIFKRHYPRRLIDFAVDLFLGKPALIVEHHDYFRDDARSLERLVGELRELEPTLTWPTLTSQLMSSCFVKHRTDDERDVQFYTPKFSLHNASPRTMRYSLSKPEPDPTLIQRVLADGTSVPFLAQDSHVSFQIDVNADSTVPIRVEDHETARQTACRTSFSYGARVRVRRLLSELRDEGAARHPAAFGALITLRQALRARNSKRARRTG
jgi:hypothetical protein